MFRLKEILKEEPKKHIANRSLIANILIVVFSIGLITWAIRLVQSKYTSVASLDTVVNGVVIDMLSTQDSSARLTGYHNSPFLR